MIRIYLMLSVLVLFWSCKDEDPFDLDSVFFSCNEKGEPFQFNLYNGLIEECKSIIERENFGSTSTSWERNQPNTFRRVISQGGLLQESLNNTNWFFFGDLSIPENIHHYQIDFELEILSGPENRFHVITWGGRDGLENYYSFGINGNQELQVGTVSNGQDFETLFYLPISTAIVSGTNLMTVRVVENKSYFFINEIFITSIERPLYGNDISFNVPGMSSNRLSNIVISKFRTD